MSSIIFYGTDQYTKKNLSYWLKSGYKPVCFSDSNERISDVRFPSTKNSIVESFEILPLPKAIAQYPDYEIWITGERSNWYNMREQLLAYGISLERIYHADCRIEPSPARWCQNLGQYFVIDAIEKRKYYYCCEKNKQLFISSGNIEKDIFEYNNICRKKIYDLQNGNPSSCDGCPSLRFGISPEEYPKLTRFNFSTGLIGGDTCNLKCIYCSYRQKLDSNHDENANEDNLFDILSYIDKMYNPAQLYISYNAGEITVSPYRDRILKLWKKTRWRGQILTNCVIYNQDIADLLGDELIDFNVSIDSGTRETYAKIKGADCYDKVVANLLKYSKANRRIALKYILLPGLNDNENDYNGFFRIATDIGANPVFLSWNYGDKAEMSANAVEAADRFISLGLYTGLNITVFSSNFPKTSRAIIDSLVTKNKLHSGVEK